ncbi:unnamed protein product, partial [Meganyctiphanes norvegica]
GNTDVASPDQPISSSDCGSFEAVSHQPPKEASSHLSLIGDRVIDNSSPLTDIGGTAALHSSATNLGASTQFCGASLISDRFLLTAAHCIDDSKRPFTISLGREDLDDNPIPGINTYGVKNVHVYPGYKNASTDYNDIAILETDRSVQYNEKIWPYCLPEKNQVLSDYFPVQIAGWGMVNQTHKPSLINTAFVKLVENSRCEREWLKLASPNYALVRKKQYPEGLTQQILCAGRLGVDSCKGDSGGPLSFQSSNGRQTVLGIISNGVRCPILPTLPGFYTNIANYIDWIYGIIGQPKHITPNSNAPHPTSSTGCPKGDGFFPSLDGKECFKIFTGYFNWDDAVAQCKAEGLVLAHPEDGTIPWLQTHLNENYGGWEYWVHARRNRRQSTFQWKDNGAEVTASHSLWYPGQPNDGEDSDICVFLSAFSSDIEDAPGRPYFDYDCSGTRGRPLCEVVRN